MQMPRSSRPMPARYTKVEFAEWSATDAANRATREYLTTLDTQPLVRKHPEAEGDLACRSCRPAPPEPTANRPFFAYSTNYLVDLENAIIVDVEATAPIRQAEVGAVRAMLMRTRARFDLHPELLAADTAYGAADMLGWLVEDQGIEPHIPGLRQIRAQGRRVSRHRLLCTMMRPTPIDASGGKVLKPYWRNISAGRPEFGKDGFKKYFARKQELRCLPAEAPDAHPFRPPERSPDRGMRRRGSAPATSPELTAYVASSYAREEGRDAVCSPQTHHRPWTASASEDPTAPRMSSTSPQPSRTSANSRNSGQCRCEPRDPDGSTGIANPRFPPEFFNSIRTKTDLWAD